MSVLLSFKNVTRLLEFVQSIVNASVVLLVKKSVKSVTFVVLKLDKFRLVNDVQL